MRKGIVFVAISFCLTSLGFSQEKEVALTVYNTNLALVKDIRQIDLKEGVWEVQFQEVAARIDPTSVHFKSLTAPEKVSILEQNYEYDLVSPDKILQKYLDQEIVVVAKEAKTFRGRLLSSSQGDIILEETGGRIRVVSKESIQNLEFPKLPEGLITRPTLVWSIENEKGGKHRTEVSYLTTGINWHAEYVGVSKQEDTILELSGWVSIDNKSGATYKDAKLKLVAGEVHRAVEKPIPIPRYKKAEVLAAARAPQFEEKAFFEYHLYTLKRPATVKDNQIKQISLFNPTETKVEKVYTYDGARDGKKVRVNLEFKNSEEAGLGMPLPKGKIRVYKEDVDKSLEFVGEDFIDHTPKDEKVRVYLGNAFDVVGERIQKERKTLGERTREETWEIKLRNHKETDIQVTVIEHLWGGEWEIRQSTHKWEKKDARTIEFKVPVEKDGETVIEYTVLYRW